jgi:hypothetical protein
MFFHRKPKNRRLGREYVLDVKLRSSQVRAARTRFLTIAGSVLLGMALGVFLLWQIGNWALDQFLYQNPAFATRQIDLETDGVIVTDQFKIWAGVKRGDNLLALDLSKVKRNLESVPFVQSVSVERVLPHTLRIRVSEREPIAQITVSRSRSGGGTEQLVFNVDAQGALMPPLEAKLLRAGAPPQPVDQLPMIVGPMVLDVRPGQRVQNLQVQAALELVLSFDRSPMAALVELKKIDASSSEVLIATTGQGSEITFGLIGLEQQLRRWHEIHETGLTVNRAVRSLDLAVSNNIPALWVEASILPPVTPRIPKILRLKKKHV